MSGGDGMFFSPQPFFSLFDEKKSGGYWITGHKTKIALMQQHKKSFQTMRDSELHLRSISACPGNGFFFPSQMLFFVSEQLICLSQWEKKMVAYNR